MNFLETLGQLVMNREFDEFNQSMCSIYGWELDGNDMVYNGTKKPITIEMRMNGARKRTYTVVDDNDIRNYKPYIKIVCNSSSERRIYEEIGKLMLELDRSEPAEKEDVLNVINERGYSVTGCHMKRGDSVYELSNGTKIVMGDMCSIMFTDSSYAGTYKWSMDNVPCRAKSLEFIADAVEVAGRMYRDIRERHEIGIAEKREELYNVAVTKTKEEFIKALKIHETRVSRSKRHG